MADVVQQARVASDLEDHAVQTGELAPHGDVQAPRGFGMPTTGGLLKFAPDANVGHVYDEPPPLAAGSPPWGDRIWNTAVALARITSPAVIARRQLQDPRSAFLLSAACNYKTEKSRSGGLSYYWERSAADPKTGLRKITQSGSIGGGTPLPVGSAGGGYAVSSDPDREGLLWGFRPLRYKDYEMGFANSPIIGPTVGIGKRHVGSVAVGRDMVKLELQVSLRDQLAPLIKLPANRDIACGGSIMLRHPDYRVIGDLLFDDIYGPIASRLSPALGYYEQVKSELRDLISR